MLVRSCLCEPLLHLFPTRVSSSKKCAFLLYEIQQQRVACSWKRRIKFWKLSEGRYFVFLWHVSSAGGVVAPAGPWRNRVNGLEFQISLQLFEDNVLIAWALRASTPLFFFFLHRECRCFLVLLGADGFWCSPSLSSRDGSFLICCMGQCLVRFHRFRLP